MFYTDWGVTLTFDLPVRRFGGYFAGLPGDATFYGVGGQPIEQTHYLTNCSPQSCAWTWNGWEFSADQPVTRIVFFGLGATGGHFQLDDLELDLAADRPPVTYCTAGTSAIGCQALLFASGTPSASASSGFTLRALGVETPNQGLFFFGTNGRQAAPWGNGSSFQCVTPPVQRGGLLSTVGAFGFCAGSLHQDLNARWCPTCPKPAQNPGPGAVVQAQLWYRDPLNTSNQTTSLSNAVEFTMAP